MPGRRTIRMRGSAGAWILLAVVLLALVAALAVWGPGRGSREQVKQDTSAAQATSLDDAMDELEVLGTLLNQARDNGQDVQTLIDRVDAVIQDHPDLAAAHTQRGLILMFAGRGDESLLAFEASLKSDPRQPKVQSLAGGVAMQLKRYEDARHHFEQAVSIEPGNGKHAIGLAMAQLNLGEEDQAVQTLLSAIRRDDGLHQAYMTLSDIYAMQNKTGLALSQIERAIELAPEDESGLLVAYTRKRAGLLRRDNKPGESLAALTALPPSAQLEPAVMLDTATSWMMLGKPAMAAEVYERALKLDPSNDLAAAQAARWRIKAGDPDIARKHIETLHRINPRYSDLEELDRALREVNQTTTP